MGTIKAILGVLVVVGAIYAGFQIIPPELTNYSFQDDLRNVAMVGGGNPHLTDKDLTDAIMKKAQEHQIPLAPENVTVQRVAGSASGVCSCRLQRSSHLARLFLQSPLHSLKRK